MKNTKKKCAMRFIVAMSLGAYMLPTSASASQINAPITIGFNEHSESHGGIVFDEYGQVLEVTEGVGKLIEATNSHARRQTHFEWGWWSSFVERWPLVPWGTISVHSSTMHRTRSHSATAQLRQGNRIVASHRGTAVAGSIAHGNVTGSSELTAHTFYNFW